MEFKDPGCFFSHQPLEPLRHQRPLGRKPPQPAKSVGLARPIGSSEVFPGHDAAVCQVAPDGELKVPIALDDSSRLLCLKFDIRGFNRLC